MKYKIDDFPYRNPRRLLSIPFILAMSIPLLLLDLTLEVYHHVSFPLYGLPLIKRSNYVRFDRHKLSYLSIFDKAWCIYCSYANGMLAYAVKLAGETEKYWCGIKHKPSSGYIEPAHHKDFLEYGDKIAFEQYIEQNKEHK